jgi:hypothetical protein
MIHRKLEQAENCQPVSPSLALKKTPWIIGNGQIKVCHGKKKKKTNTTTMQSISLGSP